MQNEMNERRRNNTKFPSHLRVLYRQMVPERNMNHPPMYLYNRARNEKEMEYYRQLYNQNAFNLQDEALEKLGVRAPVRFVGSRS
jgi:hypothetical protein